MIVNNVNQNMPNSTAYCQSMQEVKMGECNVPLSYNNIKVEEKLCKLNYSNWCPTCERESPRRRTRSETNEPYRRKQKEMKTYTPKKHHRNTEYENMELDYDSKDVRTECCRIRSNLCELPTTYITNNCQSNNQTSNCQKLSNGLTDYVEFVEKPLKSLENPLKPTEYCTQNQNFNSMSEKKSKYCLRSEDVTKNLSEVHKLNIGKPDSFKSQYNVIHKPPQADIRRSPPRNGFTISSKPLDSAKPLAKPNSLSPLHTSPSKLSPYSNGQVLKGSPLKTSQLKAPPKGNISMIQLNSLEQCAFEAKQIFSKSPPYDAMKYERLINTYSPRNKDNPTNHCSVVNVKFGGKEKNTICYDTGTFFDKQHNANNIRERYHKEIESLRARLREMRQKKQAITQTLQGGKGVSPEKKEVKENKSVTSTVQPQPVQNIKTEPILVQPFLVEVIDNSLQKPIGSLPKIVRPPTPKENATLSAIKSNNSIRRHSEFSPLPSKREVKNSLKITMRTKSKLSAVKLRKLRSKIPSSVSSSSDSTESECSDSEKSEREEGVNESEGDLNENKVESKDTIVQKPVSKTKSISRIGSGDAHLPPPAWPIRDSLFPNIPPYLNFNDHDAEVPFNVPMQGKRYFKWKLSTITPIVVRKTLMNSGFRLVRKSNEWLGTWGKHMKSPMFKTLKETQKLNHFPGTFQIGRKDRLWRNLQRLMHRYGQKEFGFIPHTYILPQEMKLLKQNWEHKNGSGDEKWIIKPPASARGVGIKVINKWCQLPKKVSLVVQQYIDRPYLINGSKFDLRLYVLVTSFNPLRIYLWPDGLARFASAKYSEDSKNLKDRYMHLTNYSINKMSSQYTANEDANACQGHKWTLSKLWEYMANQGVDTKALWKNLQDLVIKTLISGESLITPLCSENMNNRYNCYELFGIDVLLDYRLKPWLLEVNISPSLHSASPLDCHVKGPLVKTLFNMAQFHIPPRVSRSDGTPPTYDPRIYTNSLTKKERIKHNHYLQVDCREEYIDAILNELTGDDVRHLTQAEDEFVVMGRFEKIFPTKTTHNYLHFMEPRYYNRLFDAWETRYGSDRRLGIKRLQKLCDEKLHLKVGYPPMVNKSLLNMNHGDVNLQPSKDGQSQPTVVTSQIRHHAPSLVQSTILGKSMPFSVTMQPTPIPATNGV